MVMKRPETLDYTEQDIRSDTFAISRSPSRFKNETYNMEKTLGNNSMIVHEKILLNQ